VSAVQLVPCNVVSRVLVMSDEQLRALVRRGILPKAARGRYDLVACVQAYVTHLREIAAGRQSEGSEYDLVAERARLAAEQADAQAMKNEQTRGASLPRLEIEELVTSAYSACQRRFLALPTAVAPRVSIESDTRVCEAIVREYVEEALEEIAEIPIEAVAHDPSEAPGNRRNRPRRSKRTATAASTSS